MGRALSLQPPRLVLSFSPRLGAAANSRALWRFLRRQKSRWCFHHLSFPSAPPCAAPVYWRPNMLDKPQAAMPASSRLLARYENFIAGTWKSPQEGRYFANHSSIDGALLCEIARSNAAGIEAALDAAHAALPILGPRQNAHLPGVNLWPRSLSDQFQTP
jgi:hypothetical protein